MDDPTGQEPLGRAGEEGASFRLLIRNRDSKYTATFDRVFESDGTEVLLTPIRAPKANAYAERWVRTVRTECLDWTLVMGRRHLERILRQYIAHYNAERPRGSRPGAWP